MVLLIFKIIISQELNIRLTLVESINLSLSVAVQQKKFYLSRFVRKSVKTPFSTTLIKKIYQFSLKIVDFSKQFQERHLKPGCLTSFAHVKMSNPLGK